MNFANIYTAHIKRWWAGLRPQEQRLIGVAALVIALALLWSVALAPALRTLSSAPQEHARLDTQLQQMRALQAKAQSLQAQPRTDRQAAIRALETSIAAGLSGRAQMQASAGDAVSVAVRQVPADELAAWLAQSRVNARAVPREVRLTRSAAPPPNIAAAPTLAPASIGSSIRGRPAPRQAAPPPVSSGPPVVRWDGTLVLALPAS